MIEDTPEPLTDWERAFLEDETLVAALDRVNDQVRNGQERRRRERRP